MVENTWDVFRTVLSGRHSKRSFVDAPVPRAVLERVLAVSSTAPSTRNGQPWQVAVLSGQAKQVLADALCTEFDRGVSQHPDYANRPAELDQATEHRAREAGAGVLLAKGIERADQVARRQHLRDNLAFYGAPVEMIFHLPPAAPPGLFLEMGLFLQNVMLALVACGLGSCPQFSVAGYPDVIRTVLGLAPGRVVVCGLAVGYPDESATVNGFQPSRAALADYVRWFEA
jgi:nitroreductase